MCFQNGKWVILWEIRQNRACKQTQSHIQIHASSTIRLRRSYRKESRTCLLARQSYAHLSKIKGKKSIRGKDIGISRVTSQAFPFDWSRSRLFVEKIFRCQRERETGVAFTSIWKYNWWGSTLRDRVKSRAQTSTRTIKSTFPFCSRKIQCVTLERAW